MDLGRRAEPDSAEEAEPAPNRASAVFVQQMPGALPGSLAQARAALQSRVPAGGRAIDLLRPLLASFGGDFDLQAEYPLEFKCGCSMEKVTGAVLALGRAELEDLIAKEGRAVATCAFCNTVYEVDEGQLTAMVQHLIAAAAAQKPPEAN